MFMGEIFFPPPPVYEQFLNRGSITKYRERERERDNYFVVIRRILWKKFFTGQIIYDDEWMFTN